jgi:GDSL-like protein
MQRLLLSFLLLLFLLPLSARRIIKVACVGNSITYGTGVANREQKAYPVVLQRLLGKDYQVENFGKPGATLLRRGHRPYFDQPEFRAALQFRPDIAVIHLGINDTDPRNWPNYRDEFIPDYLALIDSLRAVTPHVRILVARLTPIGVDHPRFDSGTRKWREEISQAVQQVAEIARVKWIDFYAPLVPHPDWLPDAVHPDARGAEVLAKVAYAGITGRYGGLQLPPVFADNMVLQRGMPFYLKGKADAGETVVVRLGGKELARGVTDVRGVWNVRIPALTAVDSTTLTVSTARRTLTYRNVAVGEVWLCSGQSNMAFKLRQAADASRDIAKATDRGLRLYNMQPRWETDNVEWDSTAVDSVSRLQYFRPAQWVASSPQNAADFSAVAYYMGRMLRDSLRVPVGLVCNAVGGTPIESWIDRPMLEEYYPQVLRHWKNNDFVMDWVRGRATKNLARRPGGRHPYHPAYCFETGIEPLLNLPLRGVAWYQGESNAHNPDSWRFDLLARSWRMRMGDFSLPFYVVQLSGIERPSWPWMRNTQRIAQRSVFATQMVVSSDLGLRHDVHPPYKRPVGERLAQSMLRHTYDRSGAPVSPEVGANSKVDGDRVQLDLREAKGLHGSDGQPLRGFEIAGENQLFFPATAQLNEDGRLILHAPKVAQPRYVRYGWQPFPTGNVVNGAGLPLGTFSISL